jgi:hypothetical protein
MLPLVKVVVDPEHRLRSPGFKDWDEVILAKVRLEHLFPALRPEPSGRPPVVPPEEEKLGHPRRHSDVDLSNALEAYAMKVAEDYYVGKFGEGSVETVKHIHGALDLLVHTPDGDTRVEVKGRRRVSADKVEVTWREVERSQKDSCVLFVVDAIDVDAGCNCRGGRWREYPDWRVQDGDADLQPIRSLYTLGMPVASGQVEVPISSRSSRPT